MDGSAKASCALILSPVYRTNETGVYASKISVKRQGDESGGDRQIGPAVWLSRAYSSGEFTDESRAQEAGV